VDEPSLLDRIGSTPYEDVLPFVMLAALALVALPIVMLVRRRRRGPGAAEIARYQSALGGARAAILETMDQVPKTEPRDAELASEARLAAAILLRKLDDVEKDVAQDAQRMAHDLVVGRLSRVEQELAKIAAELKEKRPVGLKIVDQ
jgi:hypothetical protein